MRGSVLDEWDPSVAFLQSILDLNAHESPLATLTNESLRESGATIESYLGPPGIMALDFH